MRYFAKISYKGTRYFGWQKQPKDISVQEKIEAALAVIFREPTAVTGCGRTDTGVHAKDYVLHFDHRGDLPDDFISRLNKLLPKDIAFHRVSKVEDAAHARFDANHRAYVYHIGAAKNPFTTNTAYHFPFFNKLDRDEMQKAAALLKAYDSFFPFCKSNTQVKTMNCDIKRSEWIFGETEMVYHISADRFLRGMIRLIVGMCLNVGQGKLKLKEVEEALQKQERLRKSLSVPPQGLFLEDIRYPYEW